MAGDLQPEAVLQHLTKGDLLPVYLFHGPNQFILERLLSRFRESCVPESARDLNVQIFYGGETESSGIVDSARSLPFMSTCRLMIVRRTEGFSPAALESFLPYLENPSPTTCLIFVSGKTDFKRKFYKKLRAMGGSVAFNRLNDWEIIPWLKRAGSDLGLEIDAEACAFLVQMVGNRLQDLYSELEKLSLRHGKGRVGTEEVKNSAIFSRVYTVFELMDELSFKRVEKALVVLQRFLEEEDRGGPLKILGMINRQIKLISLTKKVFEEGGTVRDVPKKIGLPGFLGKKMSDQAGRWRFEELEAALAHLYRADGLLKKGAAERSVLENLVIALCL
jgi:DNA polymerase III subunit delta